MAHYYCFSVHPKDSHPMRAKIQAGWAYVFVWNDSDDSEQVARIGVEELGFQIQQLQDARMLTPESFQRLPQYIKDERLKYPDEPLHIELSVYEIGGGPSEPWKSFGPRSSEN